MLPHDFLNRMQNMLGDEYGEFLESLCREKVRALRVNVLKGEKDEFLERASFALRQVPWEETGFYYGNEDQPGKHPYHEAGVYYIQEPSAMVPGRLLEAAPGERVLDLCGAPGGKSTQIACAMKGKGLLICNEIHPGRARILSENIERMGVRNAVVTNETPKKLAEYFGSYFDRIMVDAPCSGEGMFRKNEEACEEWSLENVNMCGLRQDEILDFGASMLRPGGRMVYSTCTFAPWENEGSISRFLKSHPEFSIISAEKTQGMGEGRAEWAEEAARGLDKTIRLWPHRTEGEGHYAAVLQKEGSVPEGWRGGSLGGIQKGTAEKECGEFMEFCKDSLSHALKGDLLKFGEQLYLMPQEMPLLRGLKVLRPGLHLGTLKKNRFEPSHALALALRPEEVRRVYALTSQDSRTAAYLQGQTFEAQGEKGWYLITVDGYSLGWGKLAGGIMKNHYPKGLRIH